MTVIDLCSTFNGDDIKVYIFFKDLKYYDSVFDDCLTYGNIVNYDNDPIYDEKYNDYEVIRWDLNYHFDEREWRMRIQVKEKEF